MCWNALGWWSTLCLVAFIVTLFLNYQASTGLITKLDVGQVSDKYYLPITPASWTFSIWAFIYIWQACWIVYLMVLACKYSEKMKGTLLFGIPYYVFYILSCIVNASWIIVWCNEYIVSAMVLLLAITITLYTCIWISHRYLLLLVPFYNSIDNTDDNYKCINDSIDIKHKAFYQWLLNSNNVLNLLYICVLNGLPFYATWCTIASHLNVGIVISYKGGLDTDTTALIMLSSLTLIILFYWSLDFWFLKSYLKYTFSPYITLIYAFSGGVTNDAPFDAPKIFIAVLLGMAIIGTIAKVIQSIFAYKDSEYDRQIVASQDV